MADTEAPELEMYPDIEPYNTGTLKVSDIHTLFYEQCGNPQGKPVIFLHGGPGGGTGPRDRTFFDPAVYKIILMDQRGGGKSTPAAELRENTTWHLVADIERLREFLGITRWMVFGGSWGSTLALVYAETHPDRVTQLIVRGIFTQRRRELLWSYENGGLNMMYPDAWEGFVEMIPQGERGDLMGAYYRRLTGDDEQVRLDCARAWNTWETAASQLCVDPDDLKAVQPEKWSLQHARIECHYFVHGGFLEKDDQIVANVDKIRHIPTTIVQGRYDAVCPMESAWLLHKAFPEAEFYVVPDAGHSSKEPGIQSKLLQACEKYKTL